MGSCKSRTRCSEAEPNKVPDIGDLIEISRKVYQHWAIYVGKECVIHLVRNPGDGDSGASSKKSGKGSTATVTTESLKNVAGKDKYLIKNHLDEIYDPRPSMNILHEASHLVGKKLPYNVLTSNCEHFATLLRYGIPQSQQVENLVEYAKCLPVLISAAALFGISSEASLKK